MTIETMQWHEEVTVHYDRDFRRQSLVRLAQGYVGGTRILDMRCLTGTLAVALAEQGKEVVALDGYHGSVERTNALARERGIQRPLARLWDLTDLARAVDGGRFDTVVCLDVLNHVRNDARTVEDIAQALVPGGRLVAAVPAFPGLLGERDRSLGHLRRYTRAGLRQLLERFGFTIKLLRYWNVTALPFYALVERGLRGRIPDEARYGWGTTLGAWPNRALTWWYTAVENRLRAPCGLTLFVVAHMRGET